MKKYFAVLLIVCMILGLNYVSVISAEEMIQEETMFVSEESYLEDSDSEDPIKTEEEILFDDIYGDKGQTEIIDVKETSLGEKPDEVSEPGKYENESEWLAFTDAIEEMAYDNVSYIDANIILNIEDKLIYDGYSKPIEFSDETLDNALAQDDIESTKAILNESEYEVVAESENTVTVLDPSVLKRIVVRSESEPDPYNAVNMAVYGVYHVFQYETAEDTRAAYNQLKNDDSIIDVNYDAFLLTQEDDGDGNVFLSELNYADWGSQYCMKLNTMCDNIISLNKYLPPIIVGILDVGGFNESGLNGEFNGRVLIGRYYTQQDPQNNEGVDPNAYINNPQSTGHGNVCSSVVLKCTPENVLVLPIRVISYVGACAAIDYCVDEGVSVINMSYAASYNNTALVALYDEYFYQAGNATSGKMVFIAAGGNYNGTSYVYPAASNYVIAVSGITQYGNSYTWAGFAYYDRIDFCAPADNIQVYDGAQWATTGGTSVAAPYVAAAAAMLKTLHKNYTKNQIYSIIKQCAVDLGSTGKDNYYGWGYINLNKYTITKLNKHGWIMPALSTGNLTAQKLPASSTATIDWSSTDTSVVQVNSNGAVQANSYGKARIKADPSTVGISDSCTVYVRYNDVNDISEYYFRPVNWMTYNGIANGYNNQTEYRPEGTCTRGQYCSMLYRLNGSPSVGNVTNPFSDITPATTHYTAIMWAYSQGIVGGYSDGTFKPTRVCSRANVALMLWKFAGHPSVSIATLPFSDISNLSTSVQQAIV